MTLNLIMPGLYQEITVKIIELAHIKGEDVFVPVIMWGDPKKYEFEMKIGKTLWYGIHAHLKELDGDRSLDLSDSTVFDKSLSFLKNRIITIRGVPDEKHSFVGKDGKIGYAKIFRVEFQSDLEDAERIGKEVYKEAVFKYVIDRQSCRECRLANTTLAKNTEIKKEEKEVEWAKKKREKQEKEDRKKAKLGNNFGW